MRNALALLGAGLALVVSCGSGSGTAGDAGPDSTTDAHGGGAAGHGGSGGSKDSGGDGATDDSSGADAADGSDSSGATDSAGGSDSAGTTDSAGTDAPTDASAGDASDSGACTPPDMPCTTPCPSGTYCLAVSGPVSTQLGCTPIPSTCKGGKPTCACMAPCFCSGPGDKCMAMPGELYCNNGLVSRREFKKDISYVTDGERAELASQALATNLARYRYKGEAADQKTHLGFIINDLPASSPAVAADATHVDEYGYTSMLLAAVQEQQKQIEDLRRQVEELRASRGTSAGR